MEGKAGLPVAVKGLMFAGVLLGLSPCPAPSISLPEGAGAGTGWFGLGRGTRRPPTALPSPRSHQSSKSWQIFCSRSLCVHTTFLL